MRDDSIIKFQDIAYDESANLVDRSEAIDEILIILKKFSEDSLVKYWQLYLGKILFQASKYSQASQYIKLAISTMTTEDEGHGESMVMLMNCYKNMGDISNHEKLQVKYLDYLVMRKKYQAGVKFLDENKDIEEKRQNVYRMLFSAQREDYSTLEILLSKYHEDLGDQWKNIEDEINKSSSETKQKEVFLYYTLKDCLTKIKQIGVEGEVSLGLQKKFMTLMFEGLCLFPMDGRCFDLYVEFANFTCAGKLAMALNDFYLANDDMIILSNYVVNILNKVNEIKEKKIILKGKNTSKLQNEDKTGVEQREIVSIVNEVLEELSNDQNGLELGLKKAHELLDKKTLIENSKEIVTSLVMSGHYETSLFVIDKIINDIDRDEQQKEKLAELRYFKVVVLLNLDRVREAVNEINFIYKSVEMNESGTVDLLYMKAEALEKLGDQNSALDIYKRIKEFGNYRMVSQRISELEKN